ncbi:hypothetical protein [Saccharothrix xinjiangensis]|uniref:MerR-like DNA binding protein n=1 Tax=Saccharothrix xinjiangensis TaxID=204798 RepID=A0ABV9XVB1_9PSEU
MPDDQSMTGPDIITSIRSTDPRVDVVIAAFVAQRLGWTLDDPVDQVTPLVLDSMARGGYVVGAQRLLDRLDSLTARAWIADHGEDAHLAVITRLDDRVRRLTHQLHQARAALRDHAASADTGHGPTGPS